MSGTAVAKYDDWVFDTFGKHPGRDYPPAGTVDGTAAADPVSAAPPPSGMAGQASQDGAPMAGGATAKPPAGPDLDAPALAATAQDVFFTRNSPDLTPSDKATLSAYADAYINAAVPTPIRIDGWASMDGNAGENVKLSQRRADAAKAFLSDTKGIKPELIKAVGNGATSHFPPNTPAANRRAVFGPPVKQAPATVAPDAKQPDAKQPDAKQPDAKQPDAKQPDGGAADAGKSGPKKATTQVTPTPEVPVTHEEAEKIFGADALLQWNAVKGSKGPVPPAGQLSLTLTVNGSILPKDKSKPVSKDNFKLEWLADPSIAVVFNSSGPPASDQETISVFKASWKDTRLKIPIEASVLAVTQNLFTSDAYAQAGAQPQIKGKLNDQFSIVVGGTFMFGKSDAGKFGFNPAGFLGLDLTLF